ncbi:hypothetical protein HDU67_009979, partial [Dinochytrium kinnereticum]
MPSTAPSPLIHTQRLHHHSASASDSGRSSSNDTSNRHDQQYLQQQQTQQAVVEQQKFQAKKVKLRQKRREVLENQIQRSNRVEAEGAEGGYPVLIKKASEVTLDMLLQDKLKWPLAFSDFLYYLQTKGGSGADNCFAFFVAIDLYRDLYEEFRRHESTQNFAPAFRYQSPTKPNPAQQLPIHQFNHGRNVPRDPIPLSVTSSITDANDEIPLLSKGELMNEFSELCTQFLFKDSDMALQITEAERHHFLSKAAEFIRPPGAAPAAMGRDPPHPCIFDSVVTDLRTNSLHRHLRDFVTSVFEINASQATSNRFVIPGIAAILISIVGIVLLVFVFQGLHPGYRYSLALPISSAITSFWQYRDRFCISNAFQNIADV